MSLKEKFFLIDEVENSFREFNLGCLMGDGTGDFIDYLLSEYKTIDGSRNYAMKKIPIEIDEDKDKGEFKKEYQFQSTSLHYYNPDHTFTTRMYTEMLWSLNPIFWFVVRNSHLIINEDILNYDFINDIDPLPDFDNKKWKRSHVLAIKTLVEHAGFNSIKEAEDASNWVTVQEIQRIIGYDYGTTSSNIRDFRKPPAGAFSILRRKREKQSKTSDSNEYCIVVDTLGRGKP